MEKAGYFIERTIAGENVSFEWMFKDSEERNIPCEVRLNLVSAFGKSLIRGSIIDITERKQATEKLEQQKNYYQSLIENQNDGIVLLNAENSITYYSASATRISGFSFNEAQEKVMFEQVHPDDLRNISALFQSVMNHPGIPYTAHFRFLHKQGHYYWAEGTLTNMLHDENIKGIIANYRNIDERKEGEQKLLHQQSFYSSLIENQNDGIALIDLDGKITYQSESASHISGFSFEEIKGKTMLILRIYKVFLSCFKR